MPLLSEEWLPDHATDIEVFCDMDLSGAKTVAVCKFVSFDKPMTPFSASARLTVEPLQGHDPSVAGPLKFWRGAAEELGAGMGKKRKKEEADRRRRERDAAGIPRAKRAPRKDGAPKTRRAPKVPKAEGAVPVPAHLALMDEEVVRTNESSSQRSSDGEGFWGRLEGDSDVEDGDGNNDGTDLHLDLALDHLFADSDMLIKQAEVPECDELGGGSDLFADMFDPRDGASVGNADAEGDAIFVDDVDAPPLPPPAHSPGLSPQGVDVVANSDGEETASTSSAGASEGLPYYPPSPASVDVERNVAARLNVGEPL